MCNLITWVLKTRIPFLKTENQSDSSIRKTSPAIAVFENEGRGPKTNDINWPLKAREGKKTYFPQSP